MDIKDFKVGQIVFIRLVGNASRGKSGDALIEEWEIVSVGRKLIKAKRKGLGDWAVVTFEKGNYGWNDRFIEKTDCCVDYVMFANRKEIEDEFERERLLAFVSEYFRGYGEKKISLENLRKIAELIKETGLKS